MAEASNGSRVDRSKAVVLAEAYRQLAQSGLGGFSIDEVTRASGVSKTTIYRHWPTRLALIVDACSRLGGDVILPASGDLRTDLATLLSAMVEQLQDAGWSVVYPSIVDAAERDHTIAAMQEGLQRKFMAPFVSAIEQAISRGQLAADARVDELIAMIVGPLFYRRWFSREPIDQVFVRSVVCAALESAGQPPRG